jgi:hypothetical protein
MKSIREVNKRLFMALSIAIAIHTLDADAAQTNAVQFINVQLALLTQGEYKTNSPATNDITATVQKTTITTKDLISWLGTATTNTFSSRARLVRVKHFNATTNETTIEIRDGTNAPVDVSAFFSSTTSSNKVDESILNTSTGLRTGKQFEVLHFILTNAPPYNLVPYFHVAGAATVNYVSVSSGKTVLIADDVRATTLAGAGAGPDGVSGVITGSLTLTGTVREVK